MNAAKIPVVKPFGPVKDLAKTRAPCRPYLTVAAGEVAGFPGPDAACKSTPLSILLGFIRPVAGPVRMLGLGRWADPSRTHWDTAVFGFTVVPGRAESRRHVPVR